MIIKGIKRVIFSGVVLSTLVSSSLAQENKQKQIADSLAFLKTFNVKMPIVKTPVFKQDTFDIVKYGAKPDGVSLNTNSINQAIDACHKNGGGVVVLNEGVWLTGPLYLKSNVNLHLRSGALLLFTTDKSQYKLIEGSWEGKPAVVNEAPISGYNLENIAITGAGIIDGNGDAWRFVKKSKLNESQWKNLVASGGVVDKDGSKWYPSASYQKGYHIKDATVIKPGTKPEDYTELKDFYRPNLVVLNSCKKVLLEGVTFQNSPAWNLHPLMCQDLTVRNILVRNPWYAQNGDGIDVESCKNVLIEGSVFDVGDDGICIKSGRDEAGRKRGMPTEEVIVRNNVVYHAHGGFVIGSEMSGGARNLFVYNNSFIGTDIGLRFKTTRGRGGVVEKIYIANTFMKNIPGDAILFDMYYAAIDPVPMAGEERAAPKVEFLPVTEATPQFKDFYIKNVVCIGAEKGIFMRGIPEMNIQNINLEDITIKSKIGIELIEATNINLKNIHLVSDQTNPLILVENSKQINISGLKSDTEIQNLITLSGDRTEAVSLTGPSVITAKDKVKFNFGAKPKSLKINK
ncbi:glycoside hydrolase family 28 protein [Pedobacter aquae]|uniref:Glycoside hydrolase family 28 protein n=1 Tax=Pedobacter aquae TaxID=2605747 RepID=A0A5C0VQ85_9SPHI|nr:glycoside hydrolase family 28 protein [Pedobacter aquae]QEK53064.1 glycoside hydrolase family 28 protein [Pedobacter aquae]